MKKLFVIFIILLTFFQCNIIFAGTEVIYNENMYTAIVKNPEGTEVYRTDKFDNRYENKQRLLSYGTLISVEGTVEKNGEKYLIFNQADADDDWAYDIILESDVEKYDKLVYPEELRIRY